MRQDSSRFVAETARRMADAASAAASGDFESALAVWVELGHAGVGAQAEVGRCFVNGWGFERDVDLAREAERRAYLPLGEAEEVS